MKNLKRLGAAFALTLVLGLAALAGDTQTPPCAPGDVQTPPCTSAPELPDDSAPSEATTQPPANAELDYAVTAVAMDVVESLLLIF